MLVLLVLLKLVVCFYGCYDVLGCSILYYMDWFLNMKFKIEWGNLKIFWGCVSEKLDF